MAITVQLTRWVPLNFTDRRDITWFQIVVTNDLCIFIDLPIHSLTKLTSWNSNWNPKKVLHTQKMVTCTVIASWHRVLHLCVALKINSKHRTELKTENSGGIFSRQLKVTEICHYVEWIEVEKFWSVKMNTAHIQSHLSFWPKLYCVGCFGLGFSSNGNKSLCVISQEFKVHI